MNKNDTQKNKKGINYTFHWTSLRQTMKYLMLRCASYTWKIWYKC